MTTVAPTTKPPAPTTVAPTSLAPTSLAPTTAAPTTVVPTTGLPQNAAEVDSTTTDNAIWNGVKYHAHYANGYYWVGCHDGTEPRLYGSSDPYDWSAAVNNDVLTSNFQYLNYAFRFRGNEVIAIGAGGYNTRRFRRGDLNNDGTVSWDGEDTGADVEHRGQHNLDFVNSGADTLVASRLATSHPSSDRKVNLEYGDDITGLTWDGTIEEISQVYLAQVTALDEISVDAVDAVAGDAYVIVRAINTSYPAITDRHTIFSYYYDRSNGAGSCAEDRLIIADNTVTPNHWASDTDVGKLTRAQDSNEDLHVCYVALDGKIIHKKVTVSDGASSLSTIDSDVRDGSTDADKIFLTIDSNDNLYLFYTTTANHHIHYRIYNDAAGTWGAELDLKTNANPVVSAISGYEAAINGEIGICWVEQKGLTNYVMFDLLDDIITTAVPTTAAPTTVAPTTVAPTTKAPTTPVYTTFYPSTLAPTTAHVATTPVPTSTAAPTTPHYSSAAPTTSAPTTAAPTTAGPTTAAPTSAPPTTVAPTTTCDLQLRTDFSEYPVNNQPADWTEWYNPASGQAIVRNDGDIGGQCLECIVSSSTYAFTWDDAGSFSDGDILVRFRVATGRHSTVFRVSGTGGNESYYFMYAIPSSNTLGLWKYVAGAGSGINSVVKVMSAGTWYWGRVRFQGTSLKCKVWSGDVTDEPGAWDLDETDSSLSSGYAGIANYNGSNDTDFFAVSIGGCPALGPTTEPPTTAAPTTLEPTTAGPTTAAPTSLAPSTSAPTSPSPTTVGATTAAATTMVPTSEPPTSALPTTVAPTTVAPTTVAPTTKAPTTIAPTTKAPTTAAPTTVPPTTLEPWSTAAPTTLGPTTIAPTTSAPTTVGPTTAVPTTIAPTTAAPTTVPPTTAAPWPFTIPVVSPLECTDTIYSLITDEDTIISTILREATIYSLLQ